MTESRELLAALQQSVVVGDGDLDLDVRAAVERGGDVPDELSVLIDKVRRHAYKTTDADIEKLKDAGYSDDAIFEAIVAAAVGAGRVRYERGMAALRGDA